jgi:hypothetical protein
MDREGGQAVPTVASFRRRWIALSTLGALLGAIAGGVFAMAAEAGLPEPFNREALVRFGPILALAALGAAIAQWRLLSTLLPRARAWIPATTAGAVVGMLWSAAVFILVGAAASRLTDSPSAITIAAWLLLNPAGGALLGLAQRRLLPSPQLTTPWIRRSVAGGAAAAPASVVCALSVFTIFDVLPPGVFAADAVLGLDLAMAFAIILGTALGWSVMALATGGLLQRTLAAGHRNGALVPRQ